jgi:hypothetical protein
MKSCVKPLRPKKEGLKLQPLVICFHSFLDHFSFHFCFFLKLNPKSQIEHRHNSFEILVFFMTFSLIEK